MKAPKQHFCMCSGFISAILFNTFWLFHVLFFSSLPLLLAVVCARMSSASYKCLLFERHGISQAWLEHLYATTMPIYKYIVYIHALSNNTKIRFFLRTKSPKIKYKLVESPLPPSFVYIFVGWLS